MDDNGIGHHRNKFSGMFPISRINTNFRKLPEGWPSLHPLFKLGSVFLGYYYSLPFLLRPLKIIHQFDNARWTMDNVHWTFISNRGGFGDDEKGRRQTFPCVKRIPKPISCWPLCSQRRILPPLAGQTYRLRPFRGVGVSNNLFRAVGFVEHFSTFEAFFIAGCLLGGPSIHPSIYQPIFFNLKMMQRQRGKTLE